MAMLAEEMFDEPSAPNDERPATAGKAPHPIVARKSNATRIHKSTRGAFSMDALGNVSGPGKMGCAFYENECYVAFGSATKWFGKRFAATHRTKLPGGQSQFIKLTDAQDVLKTYFSEENGKKKKSPPVYYESFMHLSGDVAEIDFDQSVEPPVDEKKKRRKTEKKESDVELDPTSSDPDPDPDSSDDEPVAVEFVHKVATPTVPKRRKPRAVAVADPEPSLTSLEEAAAKLTDVLQYLMHEISAIRTVSSDPKVKPSRMSK